MTKWSAPELKFLGKHFLNMSTAEISKELSSRGYSRSIDSVKHKLTRKGLMRVRVAFKTIEREMNLLRNELVEASKQMVLFEK